MKNRKMEYFASQSLVITSNCSSFNNYTFHIGLGFHIPSGTTGALHSQLINVVNSTPLYAKHVLPTGLVHNEKSQDDAEFAHYVQKQVIPSMTDGVKTQTHNVWNLEKGDIQRIDQFIISASLLLDIDLYADIVYNVKGSTRESKFQRMYFQQFMVIDVLMNMLKRSNLTKHKEIILLMIKHKMDLGSLTSIQCFELFEKFNKSVIGHNIRRRMGKSVSMYASIAFMLSFFPEAGVKLLYAVHKKHAAELCYTTVFDAIIEKDLLAVFNYYQFLRFQERQQRRQLVFSGSSNGSRRSDDSDFYYEAKLTQKRKDDFIEIEFVKQHNRRLVSHHSTITSSKQRSINTFHTKVYSKKGVSFSTAIFLLRSLTVNGISNQRLLVIIA